MGRKIVGRRLCLMLLVLSVAAPAAPDYSAATHQLAAGDFDGDHRDDLLFIAREPWRSSGIVLADVSGKPSRLQQSWRSDHLGLDWSGSGLLPLTGSFSRGKCTTGHMGSSCVYPQDLLLQSADAGPSALLFIDHARVVFDRVQQRIPDLHMGLGWSADSHRIVTGYFDSDNYHDLFFQAAEAGGRSALVITTSLDGFPADGEPRQTWTGAYAGFAWSADAAVVVAGDFNGDGYDDLLVQARTPEGQPYAPAGFGIVAGTSAGFVAPGGGEPEAWLRWTRFDFLVPDWSATEYRLHVGNFNNDAFDDVLLQPRHAGGEAYVVLFGPRESAAEWTARRLPARAEGWHTDAVELLPADFDGDGRDQLYLQPRQPGGRAEIAELDLSATSGEAAVSFSAAALPALDAVPGGPDAGSAPGATPGSFAVDASGAATYRLPLRVPPGVRGMQPDLALSYHHRAADEWLGEGWTLAGLPRIVRCGTVAEPAVDGFTDGADLDDNDRYCLDGQRLVETHTPGEYRTEIDSRRRVRALGSAGNGPGYFLVEDAGGLRWEFGKTEDSRLRPRGERVDDAVLAYAVSRVVDRFGNAIDYRYVQDSTYTAMRPDSIRWRNADGTVLGQVHFRFDRREYIRAGWFQGYRTAVPWRLERIDTEALSSAGQFVPVRSYHLDYRYSALNGRAYLASVTECEQTAGTCLGATTFDWEPGRRGFAPRPESTAVRYQDREGLMLLDIDGNGVRDHVYLQRDSATQARWVVRKDAVDGPAISSAPAIDWDASIVAPVGYRAIPIDYDGDGFLDLVQPTDARNDGNTRIRVLRGGESGLSARATSLATQQRNFWAAGTAADIDGDGRGDLVTASGTQVLAFRSTGDDFDARPWTGGVPGQTRERRLLGPTGEVLRPIVFDADGRADLLALAAECETAPWVGLVCDNHQWLVYSLADPLARGDDALVVVHTLPAGNYINELKLLDANGDGLTDLLFHHVERAHWELHVATGTGYRLQWSAASLQLAASTDADGGPDGFSSVERADPRPASTTLVLDAGTLRHARVLDYDYDGRDDLLLAGPGGNLAALLSDPVTGNLDAALVGTGIAAPGPEHRSRLRVTDVGGDGQPDLLVPDAADRFEVFHARGVSRGLLRAVTDGLGAKTSVAYGLLRDGDLHRHGDAGFPYSRYNGPMSLVRETATPTGLGPDQRVLTRYEYLGARIHRQGRGFAGFAERRAWNVNREVSTVNRYAQSFPLTGRVVQSEQRLGAELDAPDVVTVSVPEIGLFDYPLACDTDAAREECLQLFRQGGQGSLELLRGQPFSVTTTRFVLRAAASGPAGTSWLPVAAEVEELSYPVSSDGMVGSDYKRRIVTTYHSDAFPVDAFGNPRRIVVRVDDGRGAVAHRVEVEADWENRVGSWCIGLQRSATVTAYRGDTAGIPRERRYHYDARCALSAEETLPDLSSYRVARVLEYDAYGNVVAEHIDGQSFAPRSTAREYSAEYHGRFATGEINALGHRRSVRWDIRFGAPLSERLSGPGHAATPRSSVRLDGFGRLTASSAPDSLARTEFARRWCAGDCRAPHAVMQRTALRSDGQLESVERDALGRVVHSTRLGFDGRAVNTASHYDALGRNYAVSLPYFDGESAARCYILRQHDALSRVLAEYRPGRAADCRYASAPPPAAALPDPGHVLSYRYDLPAAGGWRREMRLRESGRPELVRSEALDPWARVLAVVEAGDDLQARVEFRYTPEGNVSEVVAADGSVTRFYYDPAGFASGMYSAELGYRAYGHNALGELVFERDGDGVYTHFAYDLLGRLARRIDDWQYLSASDPRQRMTDFVYDLAPGFGLGRLAQAIGPYPAGGPPEPATPRLDYHYDERGRLVRRRLRVEVGGERRYFWTSQSFDEQGRLAELAYPSAADDGSESMPGAERLRVGYRHNARGYLAEVERIDQPGLLWQALAADAAGRYTVTRQRGGEISTMRSFDRASGLMTGTRVQRGAAMIQHLLYDWSPGGLLRAREDVLLGQREEFGHDALGRLSVTRALVDGAGVGGRLFAYDAGGNPTGAAVLDSERPQQVVRFGEGPEALDYEYDASGRVTRRGGLAIAREPSGLLRSLASDTGSIAFSYGPHRQRVSRIDTDAGQRQETTYLGQSGIRVDGGRVVFRQRVMVGREPVALVERTGGEADRLAFLHRDFAGSTTAVSTAAGVRRFAFSRTGRPRDPVATPPLRDGGLSAEDVTLLAAARGYTGQEHLSDTGLIHMNGRVLDAVSGRFLSADPYIQQPLSGQGLNRYAYALNGFMAATDPSGYSLRRFLRRLGKRLFFGTPFLLMGIPGGDLFGASIGFSLGGFMPHGGASGSAVPTPVAAGGQGDPFAVPREHLVLSATDGARLASEAPRRLVSWRIREALDGRQIGTGPGSDGVETEAARMHPASIGDRSLGLLGAELDSSERREPGRVFITGHRIGGVGPIHTALEFRDQLGVYWLSAGPEGYSLEGYRALVGGLGTARNGQRQTDAPWHNAVLGEVRPPPGVSAQAYFGQLREAAERFCNCIDYDLFPTLGGGYNSNGYVRGLVEATGGRTDFDFTQLIGGGYPVPPEFYGY